MRNLSSESSRSLPYGSLRPIVLWAIGVVIIAALAFACLAILWLGHASRSVFTQGADSVVIRAVLRADVNNVGAELVAERIRDKLPSAKIEVITETIGRSLLALQEPWIAQMPDFEVTPLPILVEIRHPQLLLNPAQVQLFVSNLDKEPEVDFVAYNETAHNRLSKLAASVSAVESRATGWLLAGLAIAGTAALALVFLPMGSVPAGRIFPMAVFVWTAGWITGFAFFRLWENGIVTPQEWSYLPRRVIVFPVVISLGLLFLSLISVRALQWRR